MILSPSLSKIKINKKNAMLLSAIFVWAEPMSRDTLMSL